MLGWLRTDGRRNSVNEAHRHALVEAKMINLRLVKMLVPVAEDLGDRWNGRRQPLPPALTSGSCPRRYAAVLYGVAFKGAHELSLELERVFFLRRHREARAQHSASIRSRAKLQASFATTALSSSPTSF